MKHTSSNNSVTLNICLEGWDPRGVGLSVPRAECFKTGSEENAFWEGTIPYTGLEARGNFTDQRELGEFYEQADEVDVLLEEYGKRCVEYSPNTLQYVGTAAGVRDMVAMHDTLEGSDSPINYWGFSYGTAIGIYFVNSTSKFGYWLTSLTILFSVPGPGRTGSTRWSDRS